MVFHCKSYCSFEKGQQLFRTGMFFKQEMRVFSNLSYIRWERLKIVKLTIYSGFGGFLIACCQKLGRLRYNYFLGISCFEALEKQLDHCAYFKTSCLNLVIEKMQVCYEDCKGWQTNHLTPQFYTGRDWMFQQDLPNLWITLVSNMCLMGFLKLNTILNTTTL